MRDLSASIFERRDFADRRQALLARIAGSGSQMVAVFGHGSALGAGTQSHGSLRYLSGWDSHEAQSLLVFDADRAVLLISSPFVEQLALSVCPEMEVIAKPAALWGQALNQCFGAGLLCATIGFNEMPLALYRSFVAEVREDRLAGVDEVLAEMRLSKSTQELAALRAGADICDDLFDSVGAALAQGRPVWQSQVKLETQARLAGAEYCKTWLTVQPNAEYPQYWRGDSLQCPADGDQVLFGIALTVDGYWAHGIRMGSIGPAQPSHRSLWSAVQDTLNIGQEGLRSGRALPQVDFAMSASLDALIAQNDWAECQRFRNGHGLGMSYEEPLATDDFRQTWGNAAFEAVPAPPLMIPDSSVFELHPSLFVPGVGGAALGEMFEVSGQTARPFLQFPLDMFELNLQASHTC